MKTLSGQHNENLTDQQLLALLKRNPETGFRALYERYSGVLLRFIFRFTGNQQMAEDLLHDVFAELLAQRDLDFVEGGLKAWLFTVAKNKSFNSLRKGSREVISSDFIDRSKSNENLEEQTGFNLNLEKLKVLEQTMPVDLSETWQLRRQGLDYQEIADHLAIPIGTVKSRFHRLVVFLRQEFEK